LHAEVQWTQVLSQANVHRHGMMNTGPLFGTLQFSQGYVIERRVFGYLTLHILTCDFWH
jgi:hypothetical protein